MSKIVSFETTAEVRDACLCLHLQRAARVLARRFDAVLSVTGLTNGQFSLLMSLNRRQPPPIGAVADLLAMDRTTLTAALKPLARRRLVEVEADANDRRTRLLGLTSKGQEVIADAIPIWRAAHAEIEASMAEVSPAAIRYALNMLARKAAVPDYEV